MGWFIERELPVILAAIILPLGVFIGMYYTFERAMRESGGTKAGYIILGILLFLYGIDLLRQSAAGIKSLF